MELEIVRNNNKKEKKRDEIKENAKQFNSLRCGGIDMKSGYFKLCPFLVEA